MLTVRDHIVNTAKANGWREHCLSSATEGELYWARDNTLTSSGGICQEKVMVMFGRDGRVIMSGHQPVPGGGWYWNGAKRDAAAYALAKLGAGS